MPRPRELGQPSWPDILQGTIEKSHRHINKAEPARVLSYDAEAQTVDVQPLIQYDMGPGGRAEPEFESSAPLHEVPVLWPGGSNGFLHMSLEPGDNVLIVHCDQDISRWLVTGSISVPEVLQLHGHHPIAIPGLRHEAQAKALPLTSSASAPMTPRRRLRSRRSLPMRSRISSRGSVRGGLPSPL
jgi:hypothetical protein